MVTIFRYIIMLAVTGLPFVLKGQTDRKGMLKCNLGLNQSVLYHYSDKPLLAIAYSEYYPENTTSIRGELWTRIGDRNDSTHLKSFNAVFLGGFYHINLRKSDFSAGLLPGIVLLTPNMSNCKNKISPGLQANISYTLYFSKHCHFFISCNHSNTIYRGSPAGSMNFSGFGISGGLGFQF